MEVNGRLKGKRQEAPMLLSVLLRTLLFPAVKKKHRIWNRFFDD
jgi:hypothetical protein